MTKKNQKSVSTKPTIEKKNSEAHITGEIPFEELQKHRADVIAEQKKEVEIDGFRKGAAPDEVVEKKLGEEAILKEAAEKVLQSEYPLLLEQFELQPIGAPHISITKLAPNNPLGYTIKTALMPEVTLPDYKKLAEEKNKENDPKSAPVEVTEEEIQQVVDRITGEEAQKQGAEKFELTDESVKTIGNYSTVKELKEKIREGVEKEKRAQEIDKHRMAIVESVLEGSTIELPELLVSEELDKMIDRLKHDVSHAGLTFDAYLAQVQKTEQGLREEWKPQAEKQAKVQLALNSIIQQENIQPDPDVLKKQSEIIMEQHPKADPEQVRVFVYSQLANEKALAFLEEQGRDSAEKESTTTKKNEQEGEEKEQQ